MPFKNTAAAKAAKKKNKDAPVKKAADKITKGKAATAESDQEESAPKVPVKKAVKRNREAQPEPEQPAPKVAVKRTLKSKKEAQPEVEQPVEKPAVKKSSKRGAAAKTEEKPAEKKTKKAAASTKTKETPASHVESEQSEEESQEPEEKPTEIVSRRKRGAPAKTKDKATVAEVAPEEPAEKITLRKRGPVRKGKEEAVSAASDVPTKKSKPATNAVSTPWDDIEFGCSKTNAKGKLANYHITTWNVAGVQAWLKKGGLEILTRDNPDVLCLQETKCNSDKIPEELKTIPGYKDYWCSSKKEGYAGVGILTKVMPIEVFYGIEDEEQDADGRCITAEFKNFYLVNVYVPNAGRQLVTLPKRLKWNTSFKAYIKKLDEKKPVIICGDMNVAHTEIDLANPKSNQKHAGFTIEEREGMTDFLGDGYVDTFRHLYPEKPGSYTFWTYMANSRSRNIGWRLDYFLVSSRSVEQVCDNVIRSQVLGSDHAPVTLYMCF